MEPVFQAIIIVVIAAAAAGTVYKTVPGMSLLLSMAAALLALFLCIGLLEPLAAFFRDAIAVSKLSGVYTGPLLKCMTISILTMIGESLCKDAGQAAGARGTSIDDCPKEAASTRAGPGRPVKTAASRTIKAICTALCFIGIRIYCTRGNKEIAPQE